MLLTLIARTGFYIVSIYGMNLPDTSVNRYIWVAFFSVLLDQLGSLFSKLVSLKTKINILIFHFILPSILATISPLPWVVMFVLINMVTLSYPTLILILVLIKKSVNSYDDKQNQKM